MAAVSRRVASLQLFGGAFSPLLYATLTGKPIRVSSCRVALSIALAVALSPAGERTTAGKHCSRQRQLFDSRGAADAGTRPGFSLLQPDQLSSAASCCIQRNELNGGVVLMTLRVLSVSLDTSREIKTDYKQQSSNTAPLVLPVRK